MLSDLDQRDGTTVLQPRIYMFWVLRALHCQYIISGWIEEWKTEGRTELNKIRLNTLHAGRLFIPQRGVDGEQTFSMYYFNTLHQINKCPTIFGLQPICAGPLGLPSAAHQGSEARVIRGLE